MVEAPGDEHHHRGLDRPRRQQDEELRGPRADLAPPADGQRHRPSRREPDPQERERHGHDQDGRHLRLPQSRDRERRHQDRPRAHHVERHPERPHRGREEERRRQVRRDETAVRQERRAEGVERRGEDAAGRPEEPPGPGVDEQPEADGEHGRHRPAREQHGADVVPLVVEEVVAEGEHVGLPPRLLIE